MFLQSRLFLLTVLFALSAAGLLRGDLASAQNPTGSVADGGLQILQGLSPEQRDALSRQLSGLGGGLGGLSNASAQAGRCGDFGAARQFHIGDATVGLKLGQYAQVYGVQLAGVHERS